VIDGIFGHGVAATARQFHVLQIKSIKTYCAINRIKSVHLMLFVSYSFLWKSRASHAFFAAGPAFFPLLDDACSCSSLVSPWCPVANSIALALILVALVCGVEVNLEAFGESLAFGADNGCTLFCNRGVVLVSKSVWFSGWRLGLLLHGRANDGGGGVLQDLFTPPLLRPVCLTHGDVRFSMVYPLCRHLSS
jgi:hypothetical protein